MSTKHIVTLPDGTTAKRTSANRVYPFAVAVSPMPAVENRAHLTADIAEYDRQANRAAKVVAYLENGGEIRNVPSPYSAGSGQLVMAGLGAREWIELYSNDEVPDIEQARAKAISKHNGYMANALKAKAAKQVALAEVWDGQLVGGWHVSGWQSRADLAATEQRKMAALYPHRTVVILDSTIS